MHPDLVGSSSLQLKFHIRMLTETFQHPVMGDGFFSIPYMTGHFFPVSGVPSHRCAYRAGVFPDHACDNAPVTPGN